ncbi:MAG: c-type cytochrome [Burkholderiaceae bacterium]
MKTCAIGLALACGVLASTAASAAPVSTGKGGDVERGRLLLRQFGCGRCHTIPGVEAAQGRVGPPLARLKERVYLAGVLPNTRDNLARWIRHPQQVQPGTAMPDMQVSGPHALDIVAYLYSLP